VLAIMVVPLDNANVSEEPSGDKVAWHAPKGGIVPAKLVGVNVSPPFPSDTPSAVPLMLKLNDTVPPAAGWKAARANAVTIAHCETRIIESPARTTQGRKQVFFEIFSSLSPPNLRAILITICRGK
jgi:hypothetical protein